MCGQNDRLFFLLSPPIPFVICTPIAMLGNQDDVIYKVLTPLVIALQAAVKEGLIEPSMLAAIMAMHQSLQAGDHSRRGKKCLPASDFKILTEYAFSLPEDQTRDTLDMFLFSYYTYGLRLQDIMALKWDDIREGKLMKPSYKTSKTSGMLLPLCKDSLQILDRWKGRHDKYIFGLIPDDFNINDAVGMKRIRAKKNALMTNILTSCAKILGIKGVINMETARKSFAYLALDQAVPLQHLSHLLGHSSTDSTISYLNLDKDITASELLKLYKHQ